MSKSCNVAALQMSSTNSVEHNLEKVEEILKRAQQPVDVLVLPENFAHMPNSEAERKQAGELMGDGPIQDFVARLAENYNCWVVAGTIPIKSADSEKVYASCIVYNEQGAAVHRYDKLHLFDVTLPNGQIYSESDSIEYGDPAITNFVESPWGKIGLSICYDVRFPELYRRMPNDVFLNCIPAAFTRKTGDAHWEPLLRARSIENQCYVVAAAQTGRHTNGRETWGHSMIVDAWGRVVKSLAELPGLIVTEVDFSALGAIREQFPCLKHKRTHINM